MLAVVGPPLGLLAFRFSSVRFGSVWFAFGCTLRAWAHNEVIVICRAPLPPAFFHICGPWNIRVCVILRQCSVPTQFLPPPLPFPLPDAIRVLFIFSFRKFPAPIFQPHCMLLCISSTYVLFALVMQGLLYVTMPYVYTYTCTYICSTYIHKAKNGAFLEFLFHLSQ